MARDINVNQFKMYPHAIWNMPKLFIVPKSIILRKLTCTSTVYHELK